MSPEGPYSSCAKIDAAFIAKYREKLHNMAKLLILAAVGSGLDI